MNEAIYLGTIGALVAYGLYRRFTGCNGGHSWGEYEKTGRIRTLPFEHTDDVSVEKEVETACQREDCTSTDSKWDPLGSRVLQDSLMDVVEQSANTLEPRYQCGRCDEIATSSEWKLATHPIRGGVKFERKCPECGMPSISDSENRLDPPTSVELDVMYE